MASAGADRQGRVGDARVEYDYVKSAQFFFNAAHERLDGFVRQHIEVPDVYLSSRELFSKVCLTMSMWTSTTLGELVDALIDQYDNRIIHEQISRDHAYL